MGQTILITGANRGIGLALVAELLKGGHQVFATTRDMERSAELETLCKRHPGKGHIVELAVTEEASLKTALKAVSESAESLDVLVNNAAVFPEEGDESIFDMRLEDFREAFETNVLGVIQVTRTFFPLLEKGTLPRIVNISSGAGSVASKEDFGYYAYAASKAALNMVTRGMAAEFRHRNICVVAMTPGWVKTDMGGWNAPLTAQESAMAIAKTITTLKMDKTSRFIERTGTDVKYGW
jgi:NAD(P)-dependent dehydrogenase (short-subunit alcohol dehydrogenase family)